MREMYKKSFMDKTMIILIVFFIINPFIKIIPIHVEIQPVYAVCIFFALLLRGKVSLNFICVFFLLTFFMLFGSFISNFEYYAVSTYLAVVSLLLLKEYFTHNEFDTQLIFKVILFCFHIWLVLGLLQSFFPSVLYSSGIDNLLEIFISRYSSEAIGGESARGIRILAPEPSYAAHVLVFFLFFLLVNKSQIVKGSQFGGLQFWVYIFLLFIVFIKNGSTTLFMMLFIFLSIYTIHQLIHLKKKFIFSGVVFLGTVVAVFFLYWDDFQVSTRFGMVISRLLDENSFADVFTILLQSGGQRIASVYVGYWALLNLESGYYFGYWANNFYTIALESGLDVHSISYFNNVTENVKPYSLGSTLSFDLGFLGLFLSLFFVHVQSWRLIFSKPLYFASYSSCVFAILFNSPVALPIYLFFILYLNVVLRKKYDYF